MSSYCHCHIVVFGTDVTAESIFVYIRQGVWGHSISWSAMEASLKEAIMISQF